MAKDRFDDYRKRSMKQFKKHRSIVRSLVYFIIFLFFVTVILDPYTKSIEETEIIITIGNYPYEKIKVAIWGEVEDDDGDGIPDDDEVDGLKLETDFITLQEGEYVRYRFDIEHNGTYQLNIHYSSGEASGVDVVVSGGGGSTKVYTATDWCVKTLVPNANLVIGTVTVKIICSDGSFSLDNIMLKTTDNAHGESQDADDFFETTADESAMYTNDSVIRMYTDPYKADSDFDGILDGYEYLAAKKGGWQDPLVSNGRYAVIIASGSATPAENFPAFGNTAEAVYDTIHDFYGYRSNDISLLYWNGEPDIPAAIIDGPADRAAIDSTLGGLVATVGPNDFVFVYITGHGFYDGDVDGYTPDNALKSGIAIYDPANFTENDYITYEELDVHMEALSVKASRISMVIEACYSGRGVEVFPRDNLVYVASSDGSKVSFGQKDNLGLFGFHALKALEHPALANVPTYKEIVNIDLNFDKDKFMISMKELFDYIKDKITLPPNSQFPQIDGDADYVSYPDGDEGIAANTYL